MRLVPAALLILASLATAGASTKKPQQESLKQWLDGPVHYLVTADEIKEFKSLKTDQERVSFIERFWRRRDPTPNTLANEYRELFWQRVKDANEKFLDSVGPGWKTDRGKIYILYGPPEEVKEDVNAQVGQRNKDSVGLIRWTYTRPGGRKDTDATVYVPFVRDVTGEYHLSSDPELSSPFFNWADVDNRRTAGLDTFMQTLGPTSKTELGAFLDLGKMQEVPPQEKFLMDSVESVETYAYEPLPLAIGRFRLDTGGFLAVVTVAIPSSSDSEPPALIARFTRTSDSKVHLLGEGSFRAEGDGVGRVSQARVVLEAGSWSVTVLAVDQGTGVSRIFKGKVDPLPGAVPLGLSDVVLARTMEPLQFATQASYDAPYLIGGFRVVPRANTTIKRGDPVRVFFEINGGTAPYHVTYQLQGRENDGRWSNLGGPQTRDAAARDQGFELPTGTTWPLGAYRLAIRVADASAAAIDGSIAWTLADAETLPPAPAAPVVREP